MQVEIGGRKGSLRWVYSYSAGYMFDDPTPDTTTAYWIPEYGGAPFYGEAQRSPRDRFCKDVGRKISLSRLLQSMSLTKEERRKVWEQYHNRNK